MFAFSMHVPWVFFGFFSLIGQIYTQCMPCQSAENMPDSDWAMCWPWIVVHVTEPFTFSFSSSIRPRSVLVPRVEEYILVIGPVYARLLTTTHVGGWRRRLTGYHQAVSPLYAQQHMLRSKAWTLDKLQQAAGAVWGMRAAAAVEFFKCLSWCREAKILHSTVSW
jgi:hypothetical protein